VSGDPERKLNDTRYTQPAILVVNELSSGMPDWALPVALTKPLCVSAHEGDNPSRKVFAREEARERASILAM
jgi:hypothetical protein